jgi:pimeloyl-ACP methyl ester carboxylesterase
MNLVHQTLPRPDCTIHYSVGGPAAAPLVVFTHGATIDHQEWDPTLPIVLDAGFRVLAWDIRGHGLSRPATFNFLSAVEDLLALLDSLTVSQALFVGHSMGGNLHQELVFRHPERVQALVMLDCTWNFQRLSRLDGLMLGAAGPIFKLYPYGALLDAAAKGTATSPENQRLLRESMQRLNKDEFVQIMMATTDCLHYEPDYFIAKPLLLMLGDQDATGNIRKVMPIWAEHEPSAELIIFRGAKHAPNLDQPDVFHEHLLAFLNSQIGENQATPHQGGSK